MRGKLLWERLDKLIFSAKLHSGNLIAFCSSIFSDMTLTWHDMSICFNVQSCWMLALFFFHLGLHICIGYFFSQHNNFHIFNVLWKKSVGLSVQSKKAEFFYFHRWIAKNYWTHIGDLWPQRSKFVGQMSNYFKNIKNQYLPSKRWHNFSICVDRL